MLRSTRSSGHSSVPHPPYNRCAPGEPSTPQGRPSVSAADPFDLERFVAAQAGVFETALAELRAGKKRTHWMWFVFPQARGLGRSPTAHHYGVGSLGEARAYLAHPLLGPRLAQATEAALASGAATPRELFGSPDDLKFCSSLTLFALASRGEGPYRGALEHFCGGREDPETLRLLSGDDAN